MKQIKYVWFDCGNVLVGYDYFLGYKKLAANSPSPLSAKKIASILSGEEFSRIFKAFETGKLGTEEFSKLEAQLIGVELTVNAIKEQFRAIFFAENKEMERVLKACKPEIGLRILSNTNPITWGCWKEYPIVKNHFKDENQFLSFRLGEKKPDKEIYLKALRACDCEINEVVFVDDKKPNIEAFKDLGGHAIQYNYWEDPIEHLEAELKKYDVLK